jgi:signal transduction histidine kinase/CheY-like chemotaxis protein
MEILLVAGFILLIFRFLVTRHLTAIGEYLKRLDLKTPPEPLVLRRKQHADELSLTVAAINEMTANLFSAYGELARELEARKAAETRLKAAYAEVEKRIAERTAALSEAKSKLEAEIREREAVESQLRQRYKMEAIGTMAGGVAHDFNNILGIIIGYAEITGEDLPPDSPAHSNLREIIDASLRGRDVVKHLIAFTRKGPLDRKPVLIADIIRETGQLVRASTSKAVEVRVKTGEDIPAVSGDENELRQLLLQLAKNAAEAMDAEGGVLTFETGERMIAPEKAANLDIEPGPYVFLTVRDTGPGIPPKQRDRIFDPYFSTKDPAVYSGMGLSIVRGIIRRHDGAIEVKSVEGRGTTVTVFFPSTRPAVLPPPREAPPPKGKGEHILLIDDEPPLATVGRQLLETLGYRVETATDPRYALDRFREAPHRFDLVITDMSMPFITGDVLSKKMLSIRADIPILLCTGYSAKIDQASALDAGIRGYVEKPLNRSELAAAVRSALSASPPVGIQDAGEAKKQV